VLRKKKPFIPSFRNEKERKEWALNMLKKTDILNVIRNWKYDKIYFKDRYSRFFFINKGHKYKAERKGKNKIESKVVHIGTTDFDIFTEEHAFQAWKDEKKIIATGKPLVGCIEKETWRNGEVTWVITSKFPLKDKKGRIIGTWGVSRDITKIKKTEEELKRVNEELKEANKKLAEISRVDPLSGLFNMRHLYETLRYFFKLRSRGIDNGCNTEFSVVLFDIDRFKTINDTYGHLAGDGVICHISKILKENIRSTDFAFRYGGDEFLILLPETDIKGGIVVANKILSIIRKNPFHFENHKISFTSSAGVSGSEEAASIKTLLKKADKKLYISKNLGRDRVF